MINCSVAALFWVLINNLQPSTSVPHCTRWKAS